MATEPRAGRGGIGGISVGGILVILGIVVLAFNLRPAAVSVGPVLAAIVFGSGATWCTTPSLPISAPQHSFGYVSTP